jgi:RNA polymerase sigma factor (sigma-70 family)
MELDLAVAFEQHFDAIHRFIARRLGAPAADDLAAQVFAHAVASVGRYDPARGAVRPWLFGIATNVIRRHRRREAAMWRAYARRGVDPLHVDAAPRDDERSVAAALAGLRARDRDALLLFVWVDLSYEEIATACGVPVGTVRSRINRARTKLRTELAPLVNDVEGERA